jgi:hypothetical protein
MSERDIITVIALRAIQHSQTVTLRGFIKTIKTGGPSRPVVETLPCHIRGCRTVCTAPCYNRRSSAYLHAEGPRRKATCHAGNAAQLSVNVQHIIIAGIGAWILRLQLCASLSAPLRLDHPPRLPQVGDVDHVAGACCQNTSKFECSDLRDPRITLLVIHLLSKDATRPALQSRGTVGLPAG